MLMSSVTDFRLALFALLFVLFSHASAASLDADEPIRSNARKVYSGKVVVEQGQLSLQADRVEIVTRQGKTEMVRATGKPVKLHQRPEEGTEEIQAEASRVDYHISRKMIDMSGSVSLRRGADTFTADILHYDLISKSLNAAGDEKRDGRVHAVIQPAKPDAATLPGP
jgi:lipopolysaccharide export system protein LptA